MKVYVICCVKPADIVTGEEHDGYVLPDGYQSEEVAEGVCAQENEHAENGEVYRVFEVNL